jgi:hypothetical protein
VKRRRSLLSVAVVSLTVLTACGASSPPAAELALEAIDSLDDEEVPEAVKACMRDEVTGFTLTEEQAQGFRDLDDVAQKAADGNEQAQNIIDAFEASLAACR